VSLLSSLAFLTVLQEALGTNPIPEEQQNLIVLRKTEVRTTEGYSEHTASLVLNIESLL
jgi:hypothetical protein